MEEGEVAITSVQKIKFTKGSTFHSTLSPSGYGIATIGTKKFSFILFSMHISFSSFLFRTFFCIEGSEVVFKVDCFLKLFVLLYSDTC